MALAIASRVPRGKETAAGPFVIVYIIISLSTLMFSSLGKLTEFINERHLRG